MLLEPPVWQGREQIWQVFPDQNVSHWQDDEHVVVTLSNDGDAEEWYPLTHSISDDKEVFNDDVEEEEEEEEKEEEEEEEDNEKREEEEGDEEENDNNEDDNGEGIGSGILKINWLNSTLVWYDGSSAVNSGDNLVFCFFLNVDFCGGKLDTSVFFRMLSSILALFNGTLTIGLEYIVFLSISINDW